MPLYAIGSDRLEPLPATAFGLEGIRERADLQRLLREQVEIISPETLVIAEEFGQWEDARRRIDLLGLDRDANLVVIELKRTEDGGHMELQALRYAAMVSAMTFEQAVEAHAAYLERLGRTDDARQCILDFLGWDLPDDDHFAQDVRIVLAAADFAKELTTAVLWLTEQKGLDIRCVRFKPYRYGEHVVLDVQQVIPLPEAADYQVRIREKVQRERLARQAAAVSARDYTKYDVLTPHGTELRLSKRKAILETIRALVSAGAPMAEIRQILQETHRYGPGVMRSSPGALDSQALVQALSAASRVEGRTFDPVRYFCGDQDLIRSDGQTWALTSQWGIGTAEAMDSLVARFPDLGISYRVSTDESAG